MKVNNLTKHIGVYIAICVVALILPIMVYICKFSGCQLENLADWGNFGSFYGGLLMPIITVIMISITLLSLKNNAKDNLYKERKTVYEKLFNYSLLMNEVVSDYLSANSLFHHDTAQNKAKNHNKNGNSNDVYDDANYKIERDMKFFCGTLLPKVSETRYYIEYFADRKMPIFETFNYNNSKCNELKKELTDIETFLKNGLSGDFSKINNKLMDNVNELFSKFLSEIENYISQKTVLK